MTLPARYPAPDAERIFSDAAKIRRWAEWTGKFLRLRLDHLDNINQIERDLLLAEYTCTEIPLPNTLADHERRTGHDLVAFLSAITEHMTPRLKRHIHYGLTSSDIVDNAHFDALRIHAEEVCNHLLRVCVALARQAQRDAVRAGRTHGQIAAPTTWSHQLRVHIDVFERLEHDLRRNVVHRRVVKSVGPTGQSPFFHQVNAIKDRRVVPSTQVLPRDYQVAWAAFYLRIAGALENLALFVRAGARSEIGEIKEGASRVGSSAMPHKENPIDSEKVTGLARVARGHFMTIAESSALWEERDLSNSSVERIAVPDLAATVEHMLITMTEVVQRLKVNRDLMTENARDVRTMSNILQTLAQDHFGVGPVEAGWVVRSAIRFEGNEVHYLPGDLPFPIVEDDAKAWLHEARDRWASYVG